MKLSRAMESAMLGFQFLLVSNLCFAQSLSCNEVTAISNMAVSKSGSSLIYWKMKSGESYIANLVYLSRSFELNPHDRSAASHFLALFPPTKEQQFLWDGLDGFLCEQEQVKEIKTLAALHARMSHDIAQAVLLVPGKMSDYVSYAYTSVQSPQSDYAVQMRAVCRSRHEAFVAAVDALRPDDRQWFVTKIFNPGECRPIALPEAD